MSDKLKILISAAISSIFTMFPLELLSSFAADDSTRSPSKGVTIIIVLLIFTISSIISAFITFRLRRKRSNEKNKNKHDS
ncbi:MAG: hypothetical protein IJM38_08170 [Ruminococcus sp.]|nr:hypothetical protein [Ruminococcus sp.]